MAAAVNKQKILDHVYTSLKKKYEVAEHPTRTIMDHLLYAIVREGITTELADQAFGGIMERFVDLNEIRVSTVQELCDAMGKIPDVAVRANRIIGVLQEWFELTYSFDMEEISKKGMKEGAKKVSRLNDATDFTVAWVMQFGLGGHAIPLDQPSIRVLRRLGIVETDNESVEGIRGTIEHFVPKTKGAALIELLSEHAASMCIDESPKCSKCPLLSDCPAGQEIKGTEGKPRKSR